MVKKGEQGEGFTGTTFCEKGLLFQRLILHDNSGKSHLNYLLSSKQ